MAKARVITALALTVVMLTAMTGLAAAADIESCDSSGNLKDTFSEGETVYVKGVNFGGSTYSGNLYVVGDQGEAWFNEPRDLPSDFLGSVIVNKSVSNWNGDAEPLGVVGSGSGEIPFPANYDIVFDVNNDGWDPNSSDMADKEVCVGFKTIPEFATIAIPVAAILGLLFFYSHRKRKEE